MTEGYCITDKTDIFVYFEIIRQTGAKSVLDVGAFLKRIGAVSRCVGDIELPEELTLDAVDIIDAPKLPVYKTIYDDIYDALPSGKRYDLIMLMRGLEIPDRKVLTGCAGAIFTDMDTYKMLTRAENIGRGVQDVTVDERIYKLVTL